MLQPKKPLDLSGANEILKSERPPLDLSGAESVLKKKDATVVNPKSASVTPSGSSVGKNSSGFPEIDMNSVAPGMGVQPQAETAKKETKGKIIQIPKPKKERGFASEVFHKLATGSAQLGADMAAVPELLYDAFAIPQNAIADYFNIPSLKADSEKFKKTIGVRNAVKDLYKSEVSKLREESARVDKKYAAGIYDSFKNGNVTDGFRQLTNSFAESLPATSTIMLGGAYTKAPQLLAASTMMFGAGKNEQLKDENPDMSTNTRVVNALGTGLAEGAFETIGSGSIGAAARGIIEREGKKKGFTILKDGLANFYKESLKKNPLVSSLAGEGVEEWATQVTQNAIDIATGVKPEDYNVFEGATDAFIGGAFGGTVFGGGLKGLEQVANYQDKNTIKANTKKVFELQNTLNNPEIPEASQVEIHKAIDGLIKTNQQLVQKNVDHVESLHPKIKEKLLESIATIEESKNKAKEIKLDSSIPDAAKKILLDKLKEDFKEANNFKNNTLEGKTTTVDVLPLKEQDKLKREALKELTAEQNPDGTKNITIDDAQITERANKIYSKNEAQQETAIAETQQEAQPQAEEQKTEQEVVANNEELRDSPKISQNQEINQNEGTPTTNTTTDGTATPGIESNGTQGENNSIPEAVDTGRGEGKAEVVNGKQIEPNNKVVTDVETVKKELKLNEVESLIYDELKDTPEDKVFKKIDDIKDRLYGEREDFEKQIEDIDKKLEDNGYAIDKVNDDESLSLSEKKKQVDVLEKEYQDLRKEQKELESKKEDNEKFVEQIDNELYDPYEEYNIDAINKIKDKINARLETRRSINEGTNLFPEEANIEEIQSKNNTAENPTAEEKINPKEETEAFEPKKGKKSLLNRLTEGGNSNAITESLKELSPNYDVRNQEKADVEAKAFIDKVGIAEALHAAKNYLIPNIDVRMLVYDEALTRLKNEIDTEAQKHPEDRDALIKQFQELSDTFDNEVRNMGQGLAILNYIYNKNQSLKYNLKKLIADYKSKDPNGEIPAEVKAKYEELTQKLKDLEEKTKVAEERAKKAEEELAIKNIQEDIERKKQLANKNKSGLTPKEVARKKELKNKFFGRLNDATGLVAMLADPEFREYLGLTFKQAKGDFKNFSNKIINELGKGAKEHLQKLFDEGQNTITKTEQKVSIGKDGKIKIPAQLFRDLVEQGYTDIDEIAQIIKESIAEEYPDVELRDIRDALTGYGKQINPNQDEITAQISKLKEYGRLLSAYEDVTNGEMPKKSGLKRLKPEQKARELRREINRLAKELNVEPIDLEKQWASALDKIKSNLKNQIEDLDKQIANGEKRKVERTTTPIDEEATALKELRDAKKHVLDDLVGKPELTEEQKIARAEAALEKSISALQEDIDSNNIAYKEKPTPATSTKLKELRAKKKALLETKKQLREEAGLVEEQRLKSAKNRIKNQIEDLKTRIANKDFAKKEVKPLTADDELNYLRAEKEMIYEEFEKQKYLQELQNRSFGKKFADEALESLGLLRAVKASLDLGLIGIQLRGFTYGELLRNPVELGRKLVRMFGAIGSQSKTNKAMANIIGHPLYHLAKKLDIGITHPDLRNEVREELASGNLLHFIWSLPVTAAERLGAEKFTQKKRKSLGDTVIDAAKKQYNQLAKNNQAATTEKDKYSIAEQWRNVNVFEAVERGLSTYGNQLRFEEFLRGVERLKAEGKDEINHPEDYKALASYIRTFSGRAKPAGFEMNQKALNVFFFSFKNAASVFQQLNPGYYLYQHVTSSDFKNGNYTKMSVANKMAMATMFKSVASTSATLLFLMAAYNAMKDDDDEEATIERDPRSSDFGKFKIGNFRYDPWGGYIPLITLYARFCTEESKKTDGTVYKFGEERFGVQSRGDAIAKFLFNKASPGAQAVRHYLFSTEKIDKTTGEISRVNSFGQKLSEDEAYSLSPIFMGSVRDAVKNDYEGVQLFLTAYSILGLGNTQYYESKEGATPEEKFIDVMEKRRLKGEKPKEEKIKEKVETKLEYAERKIQEFEYMKTAKSQNKDYYTPSGIKVDLSKRDLSQMESSVEKARKKIEAEKKKRGIKDK